MPPSARLSIATALITGLLAGAVHADTSPPARVLTRFLKAYPSVLDRIDGNDLIWRDGTRMPLDDRKGEKTFDQWLENPDIADTLRLDYPAGAKAGPLSENIDPGRARNTAFFDKLYGDCRKGEVEAKLVDVDWVPKKGGGKLKFNSAAGAAKALSAVSRELDALPEKFNVDLVPHAGTYNCRSIAGTNRVSAHGYAIAIDIALKNSDYWLWGKSGPAGKITYKNRIPLEIVKVFEKHGFIWGGRWYHYDTMHFEYRPEFF